MTGFAMCLQFHVNRKSIRWTAAQAIWSASSAALGGKIARANISAANSSIRGSRFSSEIPARCLSRSDANTTLPTLASSRTYCDVTSEYRSRSSFHHCRVASCLLTVGADAVGVMAQIADDRCLNVNRLNRGLHSLSSNAESTAARDRPAAAPHSGSRCGTLPGRSSHTGIPRTAGGLRYVAADRRR